MLFTALFILVHGPLVLKIWSIHDLCHDLIEGKEPEGAGQCPTPLRPFKVGDLA
jgi:hypothetical protein